MNLHEQQYMDSMVNLATERFVERLLHRAGGAVAARRRLAAAGDALDTDEVGLLKFTRLFFSDAMLDNAGGACAVLEAFAERPMPELPVNAGGNGAGVLVGEALLDVAVRVFAALVRVKAEEALDRAASYEGEVVS
jgi:hypothetical protein